jgi:hypothetical protein
MYDHSPWDRRQASFPLRTRHPHPTAHDASRDRVGQLTHALLLRQKRGHPAPADRGFRSGRRLFHKPCPTGSAHNGLPRRPRVSRSEGRRAPRPTDSTPQKIAALFAAHNVERRHGVCETASTSTGSQPRRSRLPHRRRTGRDPSAAASARRGPEAEVRPRGDASDGGMAIDDRAVPELDLKLSDSPAQAATRSLSVVVAAGALHPAMPDRGSDHPDEGQLEWLGVCVTCRGCCHGFGGSAARLLS